ncbi:MAG: CPBP family intramembrane metalloprotease [Elusimicrobia bacterium]|nr:CPBP family intramembrane metalloprotease [Elusimicrobiota bacterium]
MSATAYAATTTQMRSSSGYQLAWGLLAASVAVGLSLNFLAPLRSTDQWFRHFLIGAPMRLTAFGLLYRLNRQADTPTIFDFSGPPMRAFLCAVPMVTLWLIFLTGASGAPWSPADQVLALGACLAVGIWEEYLFRGVLLDGLLKRLDPTRALFLNSLLFTASHPRLQALPAWPHIFLTGAVFANLRARGVSLGYLAIIHATIDFVFFLHGKRSPRPEGPTYWVFLGGLFAYALISFPRRPQIRRQ